MILPTPSELLERFRRAADAQLLGARSSDGTPLRLSWAATSLPNIVRVAAVRLAQRALWVVDARFRASFLDTAENADLDAWAASEAPLFPRKAASSARTTLTLLRGSTATTGTIEAGSRFATVATAATPAVTFRALTDTPVSAGQSTATLAVECETPGSDGNVDPGTITRVLSPLFASFTCTNTERAAGGEPVERDVAYRDRLRQRDARYRRGTRQAIELGARSVGGVERVTVLSHRTDPSLPYGSLVVVVGDSRGVGSQPLADAVDLALYDWGCEGTVWAVFPAGTRSLLLATPSPVPAGTAALRFDVTRRRGVSGWDAAAAERDARAALARVFAELEHGQSLASVVLRSAVLSAVPSARNVTITARASDGSSLGAVTDDWPGYATDTSLTRANRWDLPDAEIRFRWTEES